MKASTFCAGLGLDPNSRHTTNPDKLGGNWGSRLNIITLHRVTYDAQLGGYGPEALPWAAHGTGGRDHDRIELRFWHPSVPAVIQFCLAHGIEIEVPE